MRHLVSAVAAVVLTGSVCLAAPARAQDDERMSNEAFLRATACAAYGSLPALAGDGVDVSAVVERVNAQRLRKDRDLQKRAAREVRTALMAARQGTDVNELRERRDRYCSGFLPAQTVVSR